MKDFTIFPRLPIKLRRKIWHETFPGSRVVRVDFKVDIQECRSSTPAPIALQICKESRKEALRFYQLSFGPLSAQDVVVESEGGETVVVKKEDVKDQIDKKADPEAPVTNTKGRIYFDFEIDTFFPIPQTIVAPEQQRCLELHGNQGPGAEEERMLAQLVTSARRLLAIVKTTAHLDKIRYLGIRYQLLMILVDLLLDLPPGDPNMWCQYFKEGCICHSFLYPGDMQIPPENDHCISVLEFTYEDKERNEGDADGETGGGDGGDAVPMYEHPLCIVRDGLEKATLATGLIFYASYLSTTANDMPLLF